MPNITCGAPAFDNSNVPKAQPLEMKDYSFNNNAKNLKVCLS